jgi:DNA-directed RNA polymerase subunit RPC12/RpoP
MECTSCKAEFVIEMECTSCKAEFVIETEEDTDISYCPFCGNFLDQEDDSLYWNRWDKDEEDE